MAHLGSMTTDKRLAFDKYVVSNKRLKEIEFEIEKNLSAVLFKKVGSSLLNSTFHMDFLYKYF